MKRAANDATESADVDVATQERRDAQAEEEQLEQAAVSCDLPPCKGTQFCTVAQFESHYRLRHEHVCSTCRRYFPSAFFLELHIAENHDPITKARQERGEKVFTCFVQDCDKKCRSPKTRRLHLVDAHSFPRDYRFNITNTGLQNQLSLLSQQRQPRRPGQTQRRQPEDMDSLTESLHKSRIAVPKIVHFGHV